jgi:hypothetical protein
MGMGKEMLREMLMIILGMLSVLTFGGKHCSAPHILWRWPGEVAFEKYSFVLKLNVN